MSLQTVSTVQPDLWNEIVSSFYYHDIYYTCGYAKTVLYQIPGDAYLLYYSGNNMRAMNVVIKRNISELDFYKDKLDSGDCFDLITPYGYGGWIIEGENEKDQLFEEYSKWCKDNKIITEFVRLHPLFNNYINYSDDFEILYSRHTIGTNLQLGDDPVKMEFSKSVRRDIRRAQAAGVTCSIIEQPDNFDVFRKLYEETMDKNSAEKEYYFPDEYYNGIISYLKSCTIEIRAIAPDNEVIGSEIYFVAGKYMHAHLLGSNHRLNELHAGALIEYTAAEWGIQRGYKYIHHGGGRSSDPEDSLYLYKKKFGKNTELDFYIGKKIWDQDVYEKLLNLRDNKEELLASGYFPAYRM